MVRTPTIEELERMIELIDMDLDDPEMEAGERSDLQSYMNHLQGDYKNRTGHEYKVCL